MKRLARYSAAMLVVLSLGCASTWQAVYASGTATSDYITSVHRRAWSEPLRERVSDCSDSLPPSASVADVDDCLGPYAHNDRVVEALARYNAAADVLGTTLLATDPNGDQSEVLAAWAEVLAAARALVELFPEGERLLRQLDAIARKR